MRRPFRSRIYWLHIHYYVRNKSNKTSLLCHLSCRLGHGKTSPSPTKVSYKCDNQQPTTKEYHQSQVFISRATPQALPFTNPRLSFLLGAILLACPTFKLFFSSKSQSTFPGRPTDRFPTHLPTCTILAFISFPILSIWSNHLRTLSSIFSSTPFVTPHSSLLYTFGTLSIPLLIPNKPLRLSTWTILILDLFSSLRTIVSRKMN